MSHVFESLRSTYHPLLPTILTDVKKVHMSSKQSEVNAEFITATFPHTCTIPLLEGQIKNNEKEHPVVRIGVIFSGGQAPGGHNVIFGLYETLKKLNPDSRLFGFLGGPDGLVKNQVKELDHAKLIPYLNTGGFDLIGSGRTKIETSEQFEQVAQTVRAHQLNGIVIIGGDDSNTNAAFLAEYFKKCALPTQVIGVPKTIDGDLKSREVELSFGFDTATKVYSELIGNVARDACSAKKYYHFIKLMGRSASHVTLECALQTHPNYAIIGEEVAHKRLTFSQITDQIADLIVQRAAKGKNYGVILVPEGLIEFIPEMRAYLKSGSLPDMKLPEKICKQLMESTDAYGNIPLSKIETEQLLIEGVKEKLNKHKQFKGSFNPISHFFGYEGRCAYPSNFDASYCLSLGAVAALLLDQGHSGYMAYVNHLHRPIQEWGIGGAPLTQMMVLEERKGKVIPVIAKTLVDLQGAPFHFFHQERERWAIEDHYQYPGSIQYFGPPEISDLRPMILELEYAPVIC